MTARLARTVLVPLTVALLCAAAASAGDSIGLSTFGASSFGVAPPCPAKELPTSEVLVPIPAIIDPFEQDLIPIFCQIQASNGGKGAKGVKGKYVSELVVRDNRTGDIESFNLGGGRFKTNREGVAGFDFEVPSELFADGFESGDVSAWSYTRTDFTNKRKVDSGFGACDTGSSRSN